MTKTTICAALAATLLAAGCASTGGQEGPAGNAPELAGKTFVWAEAVSENCELPPSITFGADGRVSGNAGCNNLIGGWKLEGKAIAMGPLGSERIQGQRSHQSYASVSRCCGHNNMHTPLCSQ